MSKRKYTRTKDLLPAIQAMVEVGMTQREIAEHYGFDSKLVVKTASRTFSKERKYNTKSQRKKAGQVPAGIQVRK